MWPTINGFYSGTQGLKKKKIFCYFHYFPLHKSSFGKKFKRTRMVNTDKIYNGLVRLPFYPAMKGSDINKIISKVIEFNKIN